MIPRLAAAGLFLIFVPNVLPSQEAGRVTFETLVKNGETRRKMYNTNKRIVVTIKAYDIESKSGRYTVTLQDDSDFEIVYDAMGNGRHTVTASRLKPSRVNVGFYSTQEIAYGVHRDGDQFHIADFIVRNDNLSSYLRQTGSGAGWLHSSFDGSNNLEFIYLLLKDNSRSAHTISMGDPTRTTRFGREVVAVTSKFEPKPERGDRAGGSIRHTSYFDPNNAFVYLGSESSNGPTKMRPWPHTTICTLEYRIGSGDRPVPKRFTRFVTPEKGEKLLDLEIDYTPFDDYVPAPEEFRLEKRYGLTTPAGPGSKVLVGVRASPNSSRVWYWASILVVAIVVGLGGIFLYRRRQSSRVVPPEGLARQ